jgi:transcriptional regulator with XRE-family HTH domain
LTFLKIRRKIETGGEKMDIGELISFYRKEAKITIDELSRKSGVPKGTINKIIAGTTKAPTLDNIKAIAHALGKTLSDFDNDSMFNNMYFSKHEINVITAYRNQPEMQPAVDRLLNIESNVEFSDEIALSFDDLEKMSIEKRVALYKKELEREKTAKEKFQALRKNG